MTIEQTWNNGGYLSGLKGVTIPNNTPSFNEDPRKGRHWSSDNAIQADDESLKGIFASLNSMPTVSQQDVQIPDRSQFHSLNHPNSLLLNNRLRKPYNNRRKRMFSNNNRPSTSRYRQPAV